MKREKEKMSQSPLKVFALVKGQLQQQPVGVRESDCHPHTFIEPTPQTIKDLPDNLKEIHALAVSVGKDVDIVKVGIGDPTIGRPIDQKTFVAPKGQRGLADKTMRAMV